MIGLRLVWPTVIRLGLDQARNVRVEAFIMGEVDRLLIRSDADANSLVE
jgi:hypothetical protein